MDNRHVRHNGCRNQSNSGWNGDASCYYEKKVAENKKANNDGCCEEKVVKKENCCENKCKNEVCCKKNAMYQDTDQLPLAMAYVPWQQFNCVYELCDVLKAGTAFPELYKPFNPKGGMCK